MSLSWLCCLTDILRMANSGMYNVLEDSPSLNCGQGEQKNTQTRISQLSRRSVGSGRGEVAAIPGLGQH